MGALLPALAVAAMVAVGSLVVPSHARAQICGDADASGAVTVSDGVAVLRTAAELPSPCTGRICDLDGNGTVSVSDGVTVLRRAAELPATLSCGTRFGELVKTVQSGGRAADLQLGLPPPAAPGAGLDILAVEGDSRVASGQPAALIVRLLRSVDSVLVAFRENGVFLDGFVEISLGATDVTGRLAPAGADESVELTLDIADLPPGTTVELSVGTTVGGQVGGFRSQMLTVVAENAPVISNAAVTVAVLNAASLCDKPPFSPSNPGSLFQITFAYADPDGDVTDAAQVVNTFRFSPSMDSATLVLTPSAQRGTPFSGEIDTLVCYRFGPQTSVDSTITLVDAAGNTSNEVTVTTPTPNGAN